MRQPLPEHGTRARYVSRQEPCRCELCRAANAAYITEYRKKNYAQVNALRRLRRTERRLSGGGS